MSEDDPMSEQAFQEYPKAMHHPHYREAAMEVVEGKDTSSGKPFKDVHGTSDRFPPVLVMNEMQEGQHLAMGYITVGKSDAAAFRRGIAKPIPPDYVPDEWPKWVAGVLCAGPDEENEARVAAGMEPLETREPDQIVITEPVPDPAKVEQAHNAGVQEGYNKALLEMQGMMKAMGDLQAEVARLSAAQGYVTRQQVEEKEAAFLASLGGEGGRPADVSAEAGLVTPAQDLVAGPDRHQHAPKRTSVPKPKRGGGKRPVRRSRPA